jgi:hypothetical protein
MSLRSEHYGMKVMESRSASAELLTHEPHLLLTGIRIHRVFEPISKTNDWIVAGSGIEWP